VLFQHEKEREEYASMSKQYGRELEKAKRQVAENKVKMIDDITKTSYEVGKIYAAANGKIEGLKKDLAEMKTQFGGFAELNDKIAKAKTEVDAVEKQRDGIAKELGDLTIQFRALSALDRAGGAKKGRGLEELGEKVSASGKKIDNLDSSMNKIKDDIDDIGR
jgi:chromosome segregation ATPase